MLGSEESQPQKSETEAVEELTLTSDEGFAEIKTALTKDTELLANLQILASRSIRDGDVEKDMILLRVDDVMAVLEALVHKDGTVRTEVFHDLVRRQYNSDKGGGVYRATMVSMHPYWDEENFIYDEMYPDIDPLPFTNYADNINMLTIDGRDVPFNTAFTTHVLPHMPPDWFKENRGRIPDSWGEECDPDMPVDSAYHNLLMRLSEGDSDSEKLLYEALPGYSQQSVAERLREFRERKGVLLAFDASILAGEKWISPSMPEGSPYYDSDDIAGEREVAILPQSDLSIADALLAIEPLGTDGDTHEERILHDLGIRTS